MSFLTIRPSVPARDSVVYYATIIEKPHEFASFEFLDSTGWDSRPRRSLELAASANAPMSVIKCMRITFHMVHGNSTACYRKVDINGAFFGGTVFTDATTILSPRRFCRARSIP